MHTIGHLMRTDLHRVPSNTPARLCLRILRSRGAHHAPVLGTGDAVVGLVSDDDLARVCRQGGADVPVSEVAAPPPWTARPNQRAIAVLSRMLAEHRDAVLVLGDRDEPVGLFTEFDALPLAEVAVRPWMRVTEIMHRAPLHTTSPDAPADRALDAMFAAGVHHLLVVVEDGRLVGVVSHRDLVGRALPVGRVMAAPVVAVPPDATVHDAARVLRERGVGCLPVVDADRGPVGILTRTDALRAVVRQLVVSEIPRADRAGG